MSMSLPTTTCGMHLCFRAIAMIVGFAVACFVTNSLLLDLFLPLIAYLGLQWIFIRCAYIKEQKANRFRQIELNEMENNNEIKLNQISDII